MCRLVLARAGAEHKDVHLARISAGCLVLKVFEPLVGTPHTFYLHVKAVSQWFSPSRSFTVQLIEALFIPGSSKNDLL